jgi:mono/diheme cytochrome c family protein
MARDDLPNCATSPAVVALTSITGLALMAFLAVAPAVQAQDVARGQKIWAGKAGCQECHGWAGDGVGSFHSEGKAPALRKTQLTRAQIRETIQCGRPGTPMPHFDRFAYTDKRCYGLDAKDLGDIVPNRAATTLQPDEIDDLAEYVATKVKGSGPVTRAQCAEYFGSSAGSRCDNYAEQ